ncbi:MAG TPA: hypothetical protein VJY54_01450 [Lachnospiraceae bacterium]|nr:hypothetical protein [Lachnospiraceae bacterium]
MEENNIHQQTNPQPVYSPIPPAVTPYNENGNKKGKGAIIAIIIVAVVVLLTLGVILVYKMFFQKPEVKLIKGFTNMAAELSAYGSSVVSDMDLDAITKNMMDESVTIDVVTNVTLPDLDTIGVDCITNYDYADKKLDTEFAISVYNIDLANGRIAAEGNRLYFSLPDFMKDTYFMDMDTLGSDYNASVWPSFLGYTIPEDTSFELFPEVEYDENSSALVESISMVMKENFANILKTMNIEDSGNVVEIEREGKTIKYSGVRVTFQADEINTLLDDLLKEYAKNMPEAEMEDTLRVRFLSDVELCVYFDNQNRIVSISTPKKVQLKNSEFTQMGFSFVFNGSERALDHIIGTLKLENEEEAIKLDLEREAFVTENDYDNNIHVSVADSDSNDSLDVIYTNTWDLINQEFEMNICANTSSDNYNCKVKGNFADIEKGKSFTMNIGDFELSENEQRLCHISGSLGIHPYEDAVLIPDDGIELLGLSQDGVENLVTEIYSSKLKTYSGL